MKLTGERDNWEEEETREGSGGQELVQQAAKELGRKAPENSRRRDGQGWDGTSVRW